MSVENEIELMLLDSKYKALVKAVGVAEALKLWRQSHTSKSFNTGMEARYKSMSTGAGDWPSIRRKAAQFRADAAQLAQHYKQRAQVKSTFSDSRNRNAENDQRILTDNLSRDKGQFETIPVYDPFFGDLVAPIGSKQVKKSNDNPYADLFSDLVKG